MFPPNCFIKQVTLYHSFHRCQVFFLDTHIFYIPVSSSCFICIFILLIFFDSFTVSFHSYNYRDNNSQAIFYNPYKRICKDSLIHQRMKLVNTLSSCIGIPYACFPKAMLLMRKAIFLPRIRIVCKPSISSFTCSGVFP